MYFVAMGEGKPVVWLHGWGCDGSIFAPVAQRVPRRKHYLLDLPGFGQSQPVPIDGWTVQDYADELLAFVRSQNLVSVTLVGHSFGCRVAMVFAAQHPSLVDGLMLVSPAGLRKFSFKRQWRVWRYKLSVRLGRPSLRHASADYLASRPLKNTLVKVVNADLSRYAKRIACPTLIVNGNRDDATPLAHARRLHKLIKGSSLAVIEGGHFAFFSAPQAFANAVEIFTE